MPANIDNTTQTPTFAGTNGKRDALQALNVAINAGTFDGLMFVLGRISNTDWNACTDKSDIFNVGDGFTTAV